MSGKLRATFAAALLAVLAFAIGLSASPQLHHALHADGDWSQHECAATIFSSGSVEHPAGGSILPAAPPAADESALNSAFAAPAPAALEFTRLEHAPPTLS